MYYLVLYDIRLIVHFLMLINCDVIGTHLSMFSARVFCSKILLRAIVYIALTCIYSSISSKYLYGFVYFG